MDPNQHQEEFPEVQAAIYRVALSLDSFLVNGIPCGVIHQAIFDGFLQKTATILVSELSALEAHAAHAPADVQTTIAAVLEALRAKCQQLIEVVTGLRSFRTLPLPQLRSTLSQIPRLRKECAQLLQELERYFRTPKPFDESRPAHSTADVNAFLNNLERLFTEERNASGIA